MQVESWESIVIIVVIFGILFGVVGLAYWLGEKMPDDNDKG